MTMNALVTIWLAGGCSVLGLAAYRLIVARREDDNLHVSEYAGPQVAKQAEVASRLDAVDKWGVGLTIAVVSFGVLLAGLYLYQAMNQGSR